MPKYLELDPELPHLPPQLCTGGFFAAALQAFQTHKNLVISPDTFLQALIAQAAVLIAKNAELYRSDLVKHTDKLRVTAATTGDFWQTFVKNIRIENKAFERLVKLKFSTTSEKTLSTRYCLIAATFSPYYDYTVSECGLRGVYVEGTLADWTELMSALDGLQFLGKSATDAVAGWIADVKSIVGRCCQLLRCDDPDDRIEWWKSFVRYRGQSGGPYIDGHITGMMLIDNNADIIDRSRKRIPIFRVPSEQLTVSVQFDSGPRKYTVGNFFYMSKNESNCITMPDIVISE